MSSMSFSLSSSGVGRDCNKCVIFQNIRLFNSEILSMCVIFLRLQELSMFLIDFTLSFIFYLVIFSMSKCHIGYLEQ